METRAYIESGILDLYAIGALSSEEMAGVECMLASHPELQSELNLIQGSLVKYSSDFERTPPIALREKILNSLEFADIPAESEETETNKIKNEPNVRQLVPDNLPVEKPAAKNISLYKMGIAASVGLLILSGLIIYILQNQLNSSRENLATASSQMKEYQKTSKDMQLQIASLSDTKRFLTMPGNVVIPLGGLALNPKASATIVWNSSNQSTYIAMDKLPVQDATKQYQLWAIVDGKPVDLGILPQHFTPEDFIKVKVANQPQAFAITIEPKGGSVSPTMEQMIVLGKV